MSRYIKRPLPNCQLPVKYIKRGDITLIIASESLFTVQDNFFTVEYCTEFEEIQNGVRASVSCKLVGLFVFDKINPENINCIFNILQKSKKDILQTSEYCKDDIALTFVQCKFCKDVACISPIAHKYNLLEIGKDGQRCDNCCSILA